MDEFDWDVLDKITQRDPRLAVLARGPEDLRSMLADQKTRSDLRERFHWRAEFWEELNELENMMEAIFHETYTATPFERIQLKKAENFRATLFTAYYDLQDFYLKLFDFLHEKDRKGLLGEPRAPKQVDVRLAADLSVREFIEKYAKPGIPVIIRGLNVSKSPWTLDFFKEKCGNRRIMGSKVVDGSKEWSKLERAGFTNLSDFIETFSTHEARREWYLHSWELPLTCNEVFGFPPYDEFIVPKYFAGDYLQRAPFDLQGQNSFQHAWPSLFIGAKGTHSPLHIDSKGTNFWFYLLSGRKEWRLFSRDDSVNLYMFGTDGQTFDVTGFEDDLERTPLLKYATAYHGTQEAGDMFFIPGGVPHAIRNTEDIHGLSMNYVDASNIDLHLYHIMRWRQWSNFEKFVNESFPVGLRSDQEDLTWGEFKGMRWDQLKYDIF